MREKSQTGKNAGCFGKIGNHYDFEIKIDGMHQWGGRFYFEGQDRAERRMLIGAMEQEESVSIEAGESILFRGRVLAHDTLFGVPFTYIEATSEPVKI